MDPVVYVISLFSPLTVLPSQSCYCHRTSNPHPPLRALEKPVSTRNVGHQLRKARLHGQSRYQLKVEEGAGLCSSCLLLCNRLPPNHNCLSCSWVFWIRNLDRTKRGWCLYSTTPGTCRLGLEASGCSFAHISAETLTRAVGRNVYMWSFQLPGLPHSMLDIKGKP